MRTSCSLLLIALLSGGAIADEGIRYHPVTVSPTSANGLGAALAPAIGAGTGYTCGAGWNCSVSGTLNKNVDGVGTVTPNPAVVPTAGTTYRVTIQVGAVTVASGATYTFGGVAGSALSAVGVYTDVITAATTGNLTITPTVTGTRFTILYVDIRAVTYNTGVITLFVPNQVLFNGSMTLGDGGRVLANSPEGAEENPIPDMNGQYNTFIGIGSGLVNTVGTFNTFVGSDTGKATTNGDQNTFVGGFAGKNNTTGYHNTYIGVGSGQNATTPSMNTFVGTDSGQYVIEGAGNTMIGASSGATTATGLGNTYVGYVAGARTGFSAESYNIAIGYNALGGGGATNDINNTIAIGRNAGHQETQSSRFYVDNFARADVGAGRAGALLYGVMADAVADQSLSINALHVNVDNIPTYANNTAALAGGLVAGDLYMVAATDPRQIAVVF